MRKFIKGNMKKKNFTFLAVMMAVILSGCSLAETKTAEPPVEQSPSINDVKMESQEYTAGMPEESASVVAETPEEALAMEETTEELSGDALEVKNIADVFCTAYSDRNIEVIKKYLSSSYEAPVKVLDSAEEVTDITVKGLADIKEADIGDGYTVSCEFKPNAQSDTFQYLTLEFIKQEDGWKIQAYGLEL